MEEEAGRIGTNILKLLTGSMRRRPLSFFTDEVDFIMDCKQWDVPTTPEARECGAVGCGNVGSGMFIALASRPPPMPVEGLFSTANGIAKCFHCVLCSLVLRRGMCRLYARPANTCRSKESMAKFVFRPKDLKKASRAPTRRGIVKAWVVLFTPVVPVILVRLRKRSMY